MCSIFSTVKLTTSFDLTLSLFDWLAAHVITNMNYIAFFLFKTSKRKSSNQRDWFGSRCWTMRENEKQFISYVLAFFAASDGIVNENLASNVRRDSFMDSKLQWKVSTVKPTRCSLTPTLSIKKRRCIYWMLSGLFHPCKRRLIGLSSGVK